MVACIIGVIALLLDQLLKFYTVSHIDLNTGIQNLPGIFQLTYIKNFGAVFGILKNAPWLRFVAIILLLAFTAVMVLGYKKKIIASPLAKISSMLLLAGLWGNGIDRAIYGYVVDMIECKFGNLPIFNLADALILIGGILFAVSIFTNGLDFSRREEEEEEKPAQPVRRQAPQAQQATQRPQRQVASAAAAQTPARPQPSRTIPRERSAMEELNAPIRAQARATAQQTTQTPVKAQATTQAPTTTQATAAKTATTEIKDSPTRILRAVTEDEVQPIRVQRPAPRTVETTAPVEKKTETKVETKATASADEFDLESILAEFK